MQLRLKKWFGGWSFYKTVMIVAAPLMLQQLIMSSVNLIDNLMVGQLGDAAIGGVGVVNRYYMIANFGSMGLISAACIFIAQFYGAKDEDHLKQTFRYACMGVYLILIPFSILGMLFPQYIVGFFTDDPAYLAQGIAYLRLAAISFLPTGITMALAGSLRSIGETKIPLFVNVIAVAVNTFFNYLLIFGNFGCPQLGVQGAAIATIIARCVEASILVMIVVKNDYPFKSKLKDFFKIERSLVRRITVKGLPLVCNEVLWASGMAMLLKLYATRGADVITAYSVAGTTSDLFFTLFGGMAGATTIIIGQKLGANKLQEAKENGYHMLTFAVMLSILFGVGIFLCSFFVPNLYDLNPATHEIAVNFLRVMSVMFWIYMLNAECYFILRSGGDTLSTMLMDSCFMWLVNLPIVAAVAYFTNLNIYMVYIAGQLTDLVKMAIAMGFLRKERWVKNLTKASS